MWIVTCFISTLFNLISCAKVRYSQFFVLIFTSQAKLNGHLYIIVYFDIAKHTNIIGCILERAKLNKETKVGEGEK